MIVKGNLFEKASDVVMKGVKHLATHPSTPPIVLAWLARCCCASVLERLAENPRTPSAVLIKLSSHPEPAVKSAVGCNPKCLVWLICKLAQDEDVDVRYSIAENPHVPVEVLSILSSDENPYVCARAQTTLRRVGGISPVRMIRTSPQVRFGAINSG